MPFGAEPRERGNRPGAVRRRIPRRLVPRGFDHATQRRPYPRALGDGAPDLIESTVEFVAGYSDTVLPNLFLSTASRGPSACGIARRTADGPISVKDHIGQQSLEQAAYCSEWIAASRPEVQLTRRPRGQGSRERSACSSQGMAPRRRGNAAE